MITMGKGAGPLTRTFFAECGRRGGLKRMKGLSRDERRLLAARAVRQRKWRAVGGENLLATTTITIPLSKRFWRILEMGRTLLPRR